MADAERNPAPYTETDLSLIKRIIPHRYPFLFIDKVRDIVPFEGGVGIKNVTNNEPHFQGHFPDQPIMPGVTIVEAMAQTSAIVVGISMNIIDRPLATYFMGIDNCKFRRMVHGEIWSLAASIAGVQLPEHAIFPAQRRCLHPLRILRCSAASRIRCALLAGHMSSR